MSEHATDKECADAEDALLRASQAERRNRLGLQPSATDDECKAAERAAEDLLRMKRRL